MDESCSQRISWTRHNRRNIGNTATDKRGASTHQFFAVSGNRRSCQRAMPTSRYVHTEQLKFYVSVADTTWKWDCCFRLRQCSLKAVIFLLWIMIQSFHSSFVIAQPVRLIPSHCCPSENLQPHSSSQIETRTHLNIETYIQSTLLEVLPRF